MIEVLDKFSSTHAHVQLDHRPFVCNVGWFVQWFSFQMDNTDCGKISNSM